MYVTSTQNALSFMQQHQTQTNNSLAGTATAESEVFQRSLLAASLANSKKNGLKKAGNDAPPVNIGWDSHMPVVSDTVGVVCVSVWHLFSCSCCCKMAKIRYYCIFMKYTGVCRRGRDLEGQLNQDVCKIKQR